MPRLILDRAAIELAAAKLSGSSIYGGPDGGLLAPGVIDVIEPASEAEEQPWCPWNDIARLFVAATEAGRDIALQAQAAHDPRTRRRALKTLTVPVCSLMDVVQAITRAFDAERPRRHRANWPARDRETYQQVGRRFRKKRLNGPVRTVRHKLGAHLDPDAFSPTAPRLNPDDLLGAMGDALMLLVLGLNHPSEHFTWIRCLGTVPPEFDIVETMQSYPATVRWVVDPSGHVRDVLPLRLAKDPRQQIQADLFDTVRTYNELVRVIGSKTLGTMHLTVAPERTGGRL